ncbi:post-transcriptional regulator [Ferviditalea candida]|uniref:Post-transcriptional regulator n=1 Tax=Ferviditalea candida TaxID=3108399 RepID=A0ABU5ZHS5_9BACL|nr:post-transcriptional regulator [Paenibacillaceae bacterium T2]
MEQLEEALSEEELTQFMEELCNSKAEEFMLLGYENVTGKDIWAFVSDQYRDGLPQLHRVVNDILSLKVTKYMNWMTLNAYKGIRF